MIIKHVKQEQKFGCAIACIAMVLGKSYWDIAKHFSIDFETEALNTDLSISYLSSYQFEILRTGIYQEEAGSRRLEEKLLIPIADVHLIRINQFFDATTNHMVVMTKEGKILDPQKEEKEEINLLETSYMILENIAIWKF